MTVGRWSMQIVLVLDWACLAIEAVTGQPLSPFCLAGSIGSLGWLYFWGGPPPGYRA